MPDFTPQNIVALMEVGDLPAMDMTAYMVSSVHDMKNSVCVMTAHLEFALAELPVDGPSRSMAYQALYEAQRIYHNLIQLLGLYKINGNIYPFDPVEVELTTFEAEVIARVQLLAKAKGVTVEVVTDEHERSWYFDYELISGLITQSLHNAIKYTRDKVRLSMLVVDNQLEIRVDDNGAGFPPLILAQGFATDQGINANTGSTGLGLYFAARAARLHRNRTRFGSTRLENYGVLGGGTFILILP
ncbi:sensor histidine kinase [Propionivibrio sp.]|uniref:sensor histidine kinase n=1 Tax=Propionivibrio sp. TaxID=2212460 RepID=UPI003BF280DA